MRLKVSVRLKGRQRERIRQRQQAKQVGQDEGGGEGGDMDQSQITSPSVMCWLRSCVAFGETH